jgi:hypothetical protein
MPPLGAVLSCTFRANTGAKDQRRATRMRVGSDAWIRGGFAVLPCKVIDLSDTGVQIRLSTAQLVPNTFTLLTSRSAGAGRPARVKWRRGTQIGAEFL